MATLVTLGQLHTGEQSRWPLWPHWVSYTPENSQEDLILAIALLFTQGHRRVRKIRKTGLLVGDGG